MKKKQNVIRVTKSNGEEAVFSEERFCNSLRHSGANDQQIGMVLDELRKQIYPGISTRQIYKIAYGLLRGNSRPIAARYNLKRAIMELGPSGFPFEKYVAAILANEGYRVKTGVFEMGKCVKHEVDVRAEKNNTICFVECKYHNHPGIDCDVKVSLYIHSRFNDIRNAYSEKNQSRETNYEGWVVTNTRFTLDAITYGNCAGLKLLGWDYPVTNGLKDIIDRTGLFPVTCLTSLTKSDKKILLEMGIVLCREIVANPKLLKSLHISPAKQNAVLEETQKLCELLSQGK